MKLAYSAKIILAWAEAVGGNKTIRDWLMKNGYPELGMFEHAIQLSDQAHKWLVDNGFPHLSAAVYGAEGKKSAVEWLLKHNFDVLANVAMAGDGDQKAFEWLLKNQHREFAMLAKRIEQAKDEIERDHNDVHKISKK